MQTKVQHPFPDKVIKALILLNHLRKIDFNIHKKFRKFEIMKSGASNIDIGFNQILALVKLLSQKEKIKLSKELEKSTLDTKLTALLKAFKTDDLNQDEIDKEVEIVRSQLYAKSKKSA